METKERTVERGQVYRDKDGRRTHRRLEILDVDGNYAVVRTVVTMTKRIKLARFRPGEGKYALVERQKIEGLLTTD